MHGGQTHEAALQKAEADFPAVLPMGLETPGHHIFVVEADGAAVGRLWLAEREMAGRRVMFIYDVTRSTRSTRAMATAGPRCVSPRTRRAPAACDRIELNVFGGNDVARGLYRSLGYVETSAQMAKDLSPVVPRRVRQQAVERPLNSSQEEAQ